MKTRCPRCFYLISAEPRTAFECAGSCNESVDKVASSYEGLPTPIEMRPIIMHGPLPGTEGERPTSIKCPHCDHQTGREVCPACHYRLPDRWRESATTCVAMAGARASGKSFYIAVAVRELEGLFQSHGLAFDYGTSETRSIYEDRYENPLFEERRLIGATLPSHMNTPERAPMIFSAGNVGAAPHRLVIRDVAGEDLERGELDPHVFSFFANADGIIFMFDPMGVDDVRLMLSGLVPADARVGGDPHLVLSSLRERLSQQSKLPTNVPVAVVLSKFDVMQQLRLVDGADWSHIMRQHGAAFLRDPVQLPRYDDVDGRLLDAETRSLLQKMGADGIASTVGNLSGVNRFFTVSSLGQHSVGDEIHPRGISPFRCLDPLKWLMALNGTLARR